MVLFILCGCSDHNSSRPAQAVLLDEAKILAEIEETVTQTLAHIRTDYEIEVVLVTKKSIPEDETLKNISARLFHELDVGRNYGGRGMLLLFDDEDKRVRLEVGSALEGIFTDLLVGHIENEQLKAYYLSDQLEIGLIAVLEEIEARSRLVAEDLASVEIITIRDNAFLSAGGGADVDLSAYESAKVFQTSGHYPAGETVDEAWQTLLQSWRDKNRNPDIGVYTWATRLIYRQFTNLPNQRFEEDVRTWGKKDYEVISNGTYGVIFFGARKGWENAPFLFCRTREGWQFDMVHQRKIVRMGRTPYWGIERGEHPYIELLGDCPYWMGQDMPLKQTDIYRVADDRTTVERIVYLEQLQSRGQRNFATLLELGSLYTLTSYGQQRITLLQEAQALSPDDPGVIWKLAIAHVDAHYQYERARDLIEAYLEMLPTDTDGHLFYGYLHFMLEDYSEAIRSFKRALELDPQNLYGRCKLARSYHARGQGKDLQMAETLLADLKRSFPHHLRVQWLSNNLR